MRARAELVNMGGWEDRRTQALPVFGAEWLRYEPEEREQDQSLGGGCVTDLGTAARTYLRTEKHAATMRIWRT